MSLQTIFGEVALPLAARAAGTVTSGPVANPDQAQEVILHVYCSAASGTSPTLNVSLEQSDDGASWSAITGSGTAQLTAAGNSSGNATPTKAFVRVTSTVAGSATPSFTYRVLVTLLGT